MKKSWVFVFSENIFEILKKELLKEKHLESQGFLFGPIVDSSHEKRILIRELWVLPKDAYEERTSFSVRPKANFLRKAATYAFLNNFVFIDIHTHPFARKAMFSSIDRQLAQRFKRWVINVERKQNKRFLYAHMVMTPDDIYGEVLDPETCEYSPARVRILKTPFNITDMEKEPFVFHTRFDRSIRLWSERNQKKLSQIKVAIVGLGGLGWNITESLARIGIRNFMLIDGDRIEESNLPRLLGAKPHEIGKYKVEALSDRIKAFWNGKANVETIANYISKQNYHLLKEADVIVGAVDNNLARFILNEAAVRYLIPYFDLGIRIEASKDHAGGKIKYQGGQIIFVNPGTTPCLACYENFFDFFEIAEGFLNDGEKRIRRELGYITDTQESPAPNVLPPNLLAVALFTNMFVNFITGISHISPIISFDLMSGQIKNHEAQKPYQLCCVCSNRYGKFALGDLESQKVFVYENENKTNC